MTGPPEVQDSAVSHLGWTVRRSTGSAGSFHDLDPDAATGHELWIHRLDRPAVILGSTQASGGFAGHGGSADSQVEVCRRRSGGGLVIATPDDVWIDAIVPRLSPLHCDDVGLAFGWLGRVWLDALRPLVARSGLDGGELSLADPKPGRRAIDRPFFCFADLGHGEVLHRSRKIVGISQRRTRDWTRLQSLLVTRWDPEAIDGLVADALASITGARPDRTRMGGPPLQAAGVCAGFAADAPPFDVDPQTITAAVIQNLPAVTDEM